MQVRSLLSASTHSMMSAQKRKNAGDDTTAKSNNKRQKAEGNKRSSAVSSKSKKHEETKTEAAKPRPTVVVAQELPAFPRGGAGLLTPLERKQIHAKATRDAISEQNQSGDLFGSKNAPSDDSELEESSENNANTAVESKTSKKKSKKAKKARSNVTDKENSIAIEGVSYKRLVVGSMMLGSIFSINAHDLTVALPNNLTGFVPLTSISSSFSAKLQKALEEKADSSEEEEDEEELDLDLASYFQVGQLVRTVVTALGDEGAKKPQSKKRIELSLEPSKVNTGLSASSLTAGVAIQAAVNSVEDHGLVMDLGLGDETKTQGFIPAKALSPSVPLGSFKSGTVLLCTPTDASNTGKVLRLAPLHSANSLLKNASSVDAFLPGSLVEILVSEVTNDGLAGKIIGMIDAAADIVHSSSFRDREVFVDNNQIGQKIKGRIISTFPLSERKKLGFSVLDHVVDQRTSALVSKESGALKISSLIPAAQVIRVASGLGIYLRLSEDAVGFAHISRLSDKKVDSVNETLGPYKLGSEHKVRILEYNPIDGLYILSLQPSILQQKFLRLEDVAVGEVVKCKIEKVVVGPTGVQGLIVNLAHGISGFVPHVHFSDNTSSLHREKEFREGASLTARVLSVDKTKRQLRLTLKKTLLNSDCQLWSDLDDIASGDSSVGTLIKVEPHGAILQFFGNVRGFLPVSEMSEAYIKDAKEHFKVGQVLAVNAISINKDEHRLTVSCRERSVASDSSIQTTVPGTFVSGTVFEKSQADLLMRLDESNVIARLPLDHVSDGSERKRRSTLEKIRVGQKLENLLVLDIQRKGRLVNLTNKQSLVKAAERGQFLKGFEDLKEGAILTGYISNITEDAVFVRFADGISGMIPKRHVPAEKEGQPNFDMQLLQAVTARVTSIDYRGAVPRFWLTMREDDSAIKVEAKVVEKQVDTPEVVNPVDETISKFADFSAGRLTKARISSVKETQINVELAKDLQGRVDISEVFDNWDDIKDRKQPLKSFNYKQVLDVRILGAHDTRNHRFLPLSHRSGKNTVFELSAKPSVLKASRTEQLTLSELQPGSSWIGYVNNVASDHLMVNISPSIRGRIKAIDVSDDLTQAADLESHFPIGSAIRVKVLSVDIEKNRLDLTGKSTASSKPSSIEEITPGMILPGRVTRISDKSILIQLSENLVGAVELIDMADDYDQADVSRFQKNDIIRVAVVQVDVRNKKVILSTRPSKVLSSTLNVNDPEIKSVTQLNVNDIVRGFVTNVTDKGVFIKLSHTVTAFVPVRHLSDLFLKNWKDSFQRDQLAKGKVILADKDSGHVQLSLKKSLLDSDYKAPRTFAQMQVGEIVTGKVVKVESFGVFVLVDNSENVRGLCHRSQIAEGKTIADATKYFNEGDAVKAKVLKIDVAARRINFGMKASLFSDEDNDDEDKDEDEDEVMVDVDADESEEDCASDLEGGVEIGLHNANDSDASDSDSEGQSDDPDVEEAAGSESAFGKPAGLSVGGFDWYGMPTAAQAINGSTNPASEGVASKSRKKRSKPAITNDVTANLDVDGPQTSDDFERLLLGSPASSHLWLQYMAYYLNLGDFDTARTLGTRALASIPLGQDTEKMHIWIALLNLENAYGDDESLESIFKKACEVNDPQEIHNRLVSIYIQSGKHSKADNLFQDMLKKYTQDPKVYINYATFLFDTMSDADRGRALLARALHVLPPFTHFDITSKFAQLEFKSEAGLAERGRTIFEGLINSFPKRVDLFNIMLDMEMNHGDHSDSGGKMMAKEDSTDRRDQIRRLFERIFDGKLKPKQAKYFFKRWLSFEEEIGDSRKIDEVKSRAAKWVKQSGGSSAEVDED